MTFRGFLTGRLQEYPGKGHDSQNHSPGLLQ